MLLVVGDAFSLSGKGLFPKSVVEVSHGHNEHRT